MSSASVLFVIYKIVLTLVVSWFAANLSLARAFRYFSNVQDWFHQFPHFTSSSQQKTCAIFKWHAHTKMKIRELDIFKEIWRYQKIHTYTYRNNNGDSDNDLILSDWFNSDSVDNAIIVHQFFRGINTQEVRFFSELKT